MNGWKKKTVMIMVGTTIGLVLWDVVVAANKEKGDTISEITKAAAHKHPMIPLGFGILMGHFFWSQSGE